MLSEEQVIRQGEPLNTEPNTERLGSSFITPTSLVFNRNHDSIVQATVPSNDADSSWKLTLTVDPAIRAFKAQPQTWTLKSLQEVIPLTEVVATLECAGNRRGEFSSGTEGLTWGNAVIANVVWGGASLRQLLLAANVEDPYAHHSDLTRLSPSEADIAKDAAEWSRGLHLHMHSVQESSDSDDPTRNECFASSVPLTTALHPNQHCLVAYQHNGEALLQRHGAPLRAVLPGHVGARWVKWLSGLRISTEENESPPMRLDYKTLIPPANAKTTDAQKEWRQKASQDDAFRHKQLDKQNPLQRLEASSSITHPWKDGSSATLDNGLLHVKGYAVGQDGSPPARVCLAIVPEPGSDTLSEDLLESLSEVDWIETTLQKGRLSSSTSSPIWSWAWTLWQADISVPTGKTFALVAKCGKCHCDCIVHDSSYH